MTKHGTMDRRDFLKLGGCLGLSAALPLISPAIGLASLDRKLKVAQDTRMLMGHLGFGNRGGRLRPTGPRGPGGRL